MLEEEEELVSFLAVAMEASISLADAKFAVADAKFTVAHFFFRVA